MLGAACQASLRIRHAAGASSAPRAVACSQQAMRRACCAGEAAAPRHLRHRIHLPLLPQQSGHACAAQLAGCRRATVSAPATAADTGMPRQRASLLAHGACAAHGAAQPRPRSPSGSRQEGRARSRPPARLGAATRVVPPKPFAPRAGGPHGGASAARTRPRSSLPLALPASTRPARRAAQPPLTTGPRAPASTRPAPALPNHRPHPPSHLVRRQAHPLVRQLLQLWQPRTRRASESPWTHHVNATARGRPTPGLMHAARQAAACWWAASTRQRGCYCAAPASGARPLTSAPAQRR